MSDTYRDNMTRHVGEVQRLNEQFDLMTEYLLHPSIAATLPSAPVVADVATGTARFLLRLHSSYPDAVLDGSDLSSALFPPQDTLPPNVSLSVLDAKQPFPKDLHGKYDLVHVRLLVAAMLPTNWATVTRNLCDLLKTASI